MINQRLLLISNSISFNQGYLNHCASEIVNFLEDKKTILFIPYALFDRDKYVSVARQRFQKMGIELNSIHEISNPDSAIEKAESLFIGGGNTFRLLNELYKNNIIDAIKKKVKNGMPYIGTSAGSNIACPSIKTTNDMPIVEPPSFVALNLIPFQINPHYVDFDSSVKHKIETREQRIKEYHEENDLPVVGLREGSWLKIENQHISVKGSGGARLFMRKNPPEEYNSGDKLDLLKIM